MSDAPKLMEQAARARRERRPVDAHRGYAAAVKIGRQSGESRVLVQALKGLGQIERDLGNREVASALYEEATEICRTLEEPLLLAHTVRHLGDIHLDSGRPESAEPCYVEALQLYRGDAKTSPLDLANAVRPFAILNEKTGRVEEARRLWEEARDLYAAVQVQAGVDECLAHLSQLGS